MGRLARFVAALLTLACASSPSNPEGARVQVFQAPLSDSEPAGMPRGCRRLASHPAVDMTELRMTGSKNPFRAERDRARQAGGNVLLVRSRMIVPRQDYNCPAASPITDCPPSEGSWNRVVFEDYACSPEALRQLRAVK